MDDLADACLFLMEHYDSGEIINMGVGQVVAYPGKIVFDPTYPDGTPRKLLDVNRLTQMGWQPRNPFREGLKKTYAWFLQSKWATGRPSP